MRSNQVYVMKNKKIKLPFGLSDQNIIIHIADIESGKHCNLFCPSCRTPLIAVKGTNKQHHFRHAIFNECEHGLESAIHLAAKQAIMEKMQITFPEFIISVSATDSKGERFTESETVISAGTIASFHLVQEEKELSGLRADLLAYKKDSPLIIEIFYRHKVDAQKIEKIKDINISAIEINLSNLMPEDVKDSEAFWSYINNPKHIQWLHSVKARDIVYPKLESQLAVKVQQKEIAYKKEEIKKQIKKEKVQLEQALENFKIITSQERIKEFNQQADTHPAWVTHSKYLKFSINELPDFLNLDIPNGDWMFSCDRRVWQTAFYSSFICKNGTPFCIKRVAEWFNNKAMCKVDPCVKILGIYGRRYPELLPADILENLPSSWGTLNIYFKHLCKLGILEFSPNEGWGRDSWFRIIRKTPRQYELPYKKSIIVKRYLEHIERKNISQSENK